MEILTKVRANRAWKRLFVNLLLTEQIGLTIRGISRNIVKSIISKRRSIIGVFLSLILIWYKLNILFVNKYSWISVSDYYVNSSFYKVLNRDLAIIVFDFFI